MRETYVFQNADVGLFRERFKIPDSSRLVRQVTLSPLFVFDTSLRVCCQVTSKPGSNKTAYQSVARQPCGGTQACKLRIGRPSPRNCRCTYKTRRCSATDTCLGSQQRFAAFNDSLSVGPGPALTLGVISPLCVGRRGAGMISVTISVQFTLRTERSWLGLQGWHALGWV